MRKIAFGLAFVFVLFSLLPLSASASKYKSLMSVLAKQSDEERAILNVPSLYRSTSNEKTENGNGSQTQNADISMVDDEVLITAFIHQRPTQKPLSVEELQQNNQYRYYVSIGDVIRKIVLYVPQDSNHGEYEARVVEAYDEDHMPQWAKDIKYGSETQVFCGVKCHILDVIVFLRQVDHSPYVYYYTDKGVFVRFYDNMIYETTLETFEYWQKFLYETEDPHGLGSLLYLYAKEDICEPQVTYYKEERQRLMPFVLGAAGTVGIAGAVTGVWLYKKRARRAKASEDVAPG